MFDIEVDKSCEKLFKKLQNETLLIKTYRRGMDLGWHQAGKFMVTKIQDSILNPPKTGRIYKINNKVHQASAPGEAPADLTSNLRQLTHYTSKGTEMEVGYSSQTPYGKILEEGSRGGKIQPRPNIQLHGVEQAGPIQKMLEQQINNTMHKWLGA